MDILKIMLLGLACWRITALISQEDGPFKLFRKLREMLGITHYADGKVCEVPDKFWCELLSCLWCLSVWVAGGLTLLYIFLPQFAIYFAMWLSLSTITIVVNDGVLR